MLGPLAEQSLITLLIALSLYGLPSLVAWQRSHHNLPAILLVNLLLGWTVLGWIGALVWAVMNPPPKG